MVVLFSSYLCSLIFVGRVVLFFFGLVALGILIYCSVGKSGKLVAKLCLKGRGCITTTQIHIISFAYGLYSNSYRRRMWENLSSLAGSQNLPWMITRAASALQIEDRLGGRDPSPYDIRDFSSFCQEMEVTDLNAIGLVADLHGPIAQSLTLSGAKLIEQWETLLGSSHILIQWQTSCPQGLCLITLPVLLVFIFQRQDLKATSIQHVG